MSPSEILKVIPLRELSKFTLGAGIVYLLANLLVYLFLLIPHFKPEGAYALTQILMIAVNFALNRWWVFKSTSPAVKKQLAFFILTNITFRFLDWLIFVLLLDLFTPPLPLAIFIAMALVFPIKFFVYRTRVFGSKG